MTDADIKVVYGILEEVSARRISLAEARPLVRDLKTDPVPCPHCGQRAYPRTSHQ